MNKLDNIKEDYLKPMPILYTYKGHIEQSLISNDINTCVDIVLTESMNEVKKLTFSIPFTVDRKIDHNSLEKLVYFNGIYFSIKGIEEDSDSKDIKVTCEEICTALKTIFCENVTKIGATPKEIFDAIISATKFSNLGYKWGGTDVDNGVYRHVVTENETSCYENLVSLAKVFDGHLEFTYDELTGDSYVFIRTKPIDTGKFIKKDIEMKTLNLTASSTDLFTQYYPTGKTDDYGITLDVQAVNDGQSILRDYSYYSNVLGIPDDVILNDPLYNSLRTVSDDTYVDATDLLNDSKTELKKCAKPQFTAEIEMSDFSVFEDSPIESPRIGMSLRCIDKSINFIFDCTIIGIERNYNNPMDTKITISNIIKYDTSQQNTNHAISTVNSVTSCDPRDTDGNIIGTGENYVKMESVKDGDHVNAVMRNAETKSLITQTATEIGLRVDDINHSYAELKVTADSITSTVEDTSDVANRTYSAITQTATKITAVVAQNAETGSWELNKDAFVVAFNGSTNNKVVIDRTEGLKIGNLTTGTYSQVGYDGRLTLYTGGDTKPYHCLSYTDSIDFPCTGGDGDYTSMSTTLPNMFDNIPNDQISVSISIQKFYKSGYYLPYWIGGYGEVIGTTSKTLKLYGMSAWRSYSTTSVVDDVSFDGSDVSTSTTSVIHNIGSPVNGNIILRFTVIA